MIFNYTKTESIRIIKSCFSSLSINGIEHYSFEFTNVNNPVFARNTNRAVFTNTDYNVKYTLDFFDNSPSEFTYITLKFYVGKKLIFTANAEFIPSDFARDFVIKAA